MRTWVISDTHFNHNKLIELEGRPEDFTERIIRNCQRMIAPEDFVIHLGDVIVGVNRMLSAYMERLPGEWLLVRGNHDHETFTKYRKCGFTAVLDAFELSGCLFTHKPAKTLPEGCWLNIHGHLHSNGHRDSEVELQDWHKCFVLEHTDYSPVLLETFKRKSDG